MSLVKKLNLKQGEELIIVNNPYDINSPLTNLNEELTINEFMGETSGIMNVLVFAENKAQLDDIKHKIMPLVNPESKVWFAYPKKSSKAYKSDLSRDMMWEEFKEFNYRPVRQISIDSDWSALRFRPADLVKSK